VGLCKAEVSEKFGGNVELRDGGLEAADADATKKGGRKMEMFTECSITLLGTYQ